MKRNYRKVWAQTISEMYMLSNVLQVTPNQPQLTYTCTLSVYIALFAINVYYNQQSNKSIFVLYHALKHTHTYCKLAKSEWRV